MEISSKYDPSQVESKWYAHWLKNKFFASKPDSTKKPFTIVIPPPNVTGVLHMGHMLNNTIQDALIRHARMQGYNACWVPGTDHASIATEAKVVNLLKSKGIEKKDISREEFLKYAFEWKDKYGGIILEQLKKLGASCDWDRTRFTMEKDLSDAVLDSFIHLYNKGLVYRGVRMVNWDPQGKTALSDEEVIFKESQSKMVYVKYFIADDNGKATTDFITIATVRPETIPGDTGVCVNPNDARYTHLKGKKVIIPLVNRLVPVVFDDYIDIDFGTGALKVTPAHDVNDYALGQKFNLAVIDTISDDGTMSENVGIAKYVGKDRFFVRKEIVKDLEALGQVEKVEEYKNQVGTSERTGAVIEPKLSMQWWLKMEDIAKPALDNVMNDTIRFFPDKFKNMYRSWLDNPKDWCISRQLWWGQQIPAYYLPNGELIIAKTKEEALIKAQIIDKNLTISDLRQDEDVLDTWFSSWLWPISVFDGFKNPDNEDIKYYYPTNVLVTGFDIIFFWVARMIMAGYEFKQEMPFKDVYFTGLIRDKLGRKMSKQLGNSPDALRLMEMYSADGVRFGVLFNSGAGNDLMFDTDVPKSSKQEDIDAFALAENSHDSKLCEQGRNFANKIWNAFRLLRSFEIVDNQILTQPEINILAAMWFDARFSEKLAEIEDHYTKYRMSEALQNIYKLFWDDFCAYYLEIIKPEYEKPLDKATYEQAIGFLDNLLRVLHPFMPFITEEVWQNISERKENESICVANYPEIKEFDKAILADASLIFDAVTEIRNVRNANGLAPKAPLAIIIKTEKNASVYEKWHNILQKLTSTTLTYTQENVSAGLKFLVTTDEFFAQIDVKIDLEQIKKDLEYQKGFKESVLKKLSNEKFVANAKPEVIENERKKLADAEAKIKSLENDLNNN